MKTLGFLVAASLSAAAANAEISYSYFEAGYSWTSIDVPAPFDGGGHGPQLEASHPVWGPVHLFGGYRQTDFDDDGVEFDEYRIGLGLAQPIGKDASLFLRLGFSQTEIAAGGFDFTEDGYIATLGYRAENHSPWEFLGTIDYINIESGVAVGGGISLEYELTRHLRITGGAQYFDQSTVGFVGLRFYVGGRD